MARKDIIALHLAEDKHRDMKNVQGLLTILLSKPMCGDPEIMKAPITLLHELVQHPAQGGYRAIVTQAEPKRAVVVQTEEAVGPAAAGQEVIRSSYLN